MTTPNDERVFAKSSHGPKTGGRVAVIDDEEKIRAIADGLDAAIHEAWPGLAMSLSDYVRSVLRVGVGRLRRAEEIMRGLHGNDATFEAAQATRPVGAQRAHDGVWWWRVPMTRGSWTDGVQRTAHPPAGVRWRGYVGGGQDLAHIVDGGRSLCRRGLPPLIAADPTVPVCAWCQRAAGREMTGE